jgi:hypothetical protein
MIFSKSLRASMEKLRNIKHNQKYKTENAK